MAKTYDFDKLRWQPARVFKSSPKPIIGWDTETHQGNVLMLCGEGPPLGEPITLFDDLNIIPWQTILDTIYRPKATGLWWNLRYDIECILKQLPEKHLHDIVTGEVTIIDGWSIKYIPKKAFLLRRLVPSRKHKGKMVPSHTSCHFDLAQFYQSSLQDAATEYLGQGKLESISSKELGRDLEYWRPRISEIERYCIQDCLRTRQLGDLWLKWAQELGLDFSKPFSPAFVAGIYAWDKGWPNYGEYLHDTVGRAAFASYLGGRFEPRIKGTFEELHLADIRSAYPSVMADLPPSNANWERCSKEGRALGAAWGFVHARIAVADGAQWSPIMTRRKGKVIAPTGSYGKVWITLDEYRACVEDPNTKTNFIKAWIADDNGERPLAWIRDIYLERVKRKQNGEAVELALKILMNSVYGKMLQRRPVKDTTYLRMANTDDLEDPNSQITVIDGIPHVAEAAEWLCGPLFNPIWGSTVTARTRLQLWELMQEVDTAMVMTDGLLATEKIPRSFLGPELGDWEDGGCKPGLILGNGMYEREGERAKRRGFGNPETKWSWVQALRESKPTATKITVAYERPLHPGEVMKSVTHSVTDIGCFVEESKDIALNDNEKRVFPKLNARKLLEGTYYGRPVSA